MNNIAEMPNQGAAVRQIIRSAPNLPQSAALETSRAESVLSSEDIRKLYMEDFEWDRTSESWKALIPKRNFNTFELTDETEEEYKERLLPRFNIPLAVIKQWLYPLYYERNSTNNYGWINYDNIEFIKRNLSFKVLSELSVISEYQFHVDEGAKYKAYEQLPCIDRDQEYWVKHSTWRVPPLILDVHSLKSENIPNHADIKGQFQIVEGHSRLGYLYAAKNCGVLNKKEHSVYIMRIKND